MSRRVLAGVLVLAAILRGLPLLAPHLGIELEEGYPQHAVLSLIAGSWKPFALVHGSLLSDALRVLCSLAYGVGHAAGAYPERVDVLVRFVRDPLPFVVAGRLVLLGASLAAVWLAACVAARVGGPLAGPAAAAVLATCLVHVRETLHVWPDALAATLAVATIAAALAHLDRSTRRSAAVLGTVAGLALAAKPTVGPLVVPVVLALWWGAVAWRSRARGAAVAAGAALAAFVLVSPHWLIDWRELLLMLRVQAMGSFTVSPHRIPFAELLGMTLGAGPLVLAGLGLVVVARGERRALAVVAAFPLVYLALLARANPFARYVAVAAPLVAAVAGAGAAGVAARLAPRRAAVVATLLVVLACAEPAWRSWQHVRLVRRPDTRLLAGAWLAAHVAPGTPVTLPNLVGYANPVVAPDAQALRLHHPRWHAALVARGLGDPARTFRLRYQGMLSNYDGGFAPRDPVVVTAAHPSPLTALSTPAVNDERLRAAGYRVAARFPGPPDPLRADVVYDPLDADYLPIVGAASIPALGPTLTIWLAPATPPPH